MRQRLRTNLVSGDPAGRAAPRRRRLPTVVAPTLLLAALLAGCTQTPSFENLEATRAWAIGSGGGPPPAIGDDENPPVRPLSGGQPRTLGTSPPFPDAGVGRVARDRRLEREQQRIEGRLRTVDRTLDFIETRQRRRQLIDPDLRTRTTGRERLLRQEQRALTATGKAVQRDLDTLEFRQRIGRSPRSIGGDPLGPRPGSIFQR